MHLPCSSSIIMVDGIPEVKYNSKYPPILSLYVAVAEKIRTFYQTETIPILVYPTHSNVERYCPYEAIKCKKTLFDHIVFSTSSITLSSFFQSFHNFLCPPKELWEAYSNRTVRPSVCPSVRPSVRPSRFRVRSISPIFFEVGIPNLVCGYILGWRTVAYHFRVNLTLTLTSDLVLRIIVSGAYPLYYLR